MLPSFSDDVPGAKRGQPKRLSRNYRRRNGGNVIVYVLISFHSRDVLSAVFFSFCSTGLSFVLRSFGCSLFGRLLGFRVFIIKHYLTDTATATSAMAV